MKGSEIIAKLKSKFGVETNKALADKIGYSEEGIRGWEVRTKCTGRQIAELVHKASEARAEHVQGHAIRTIVEFFPIDACPSAKGAKQELFPTQTKRGEDHKYRAGLRDELELGRGVYLFFDSRGQAIYAGKAKAQSLWTEMNNAFNRDRRVQQLWRVDHPKNNVSYQNSDEKQRQICSRGVALHELAKYFSAYDITPNMIDEIEAMLVRSFANDLSNVRMEKLGKKRKKKAK